MGQAVVVLYFLASFFLISLIVVNLPFGTFFIKVFTSNGEGITNFPLPQDLFKYFGIVFIFGKSVFLNNFSLNFLFFFTTTNPEPKSLSLSSCHPNLTPNFIESQVPESVGVFL